MFKMPTHFKKDVLRNNDVNPVPTSMVTNPNPSQSKEQCQNDKKVQCQNKQTHNRQSIVLHAADGPLRQALDSSTPPTSSNSTPLLTASLNSPPVAHAHSSAPTSPGPSTSPLFTTSGLIAVAQENGSVDLSLSAAQKLNNIVKEDLKPQHKPADLYTNLLMRLKQRTSVSSSPSVVVQKLSAAARKEKLKAQPCFQCPVCKKRFQRHIAMNAHFQNEHIGQIQSDKVCKMCSHRSKNMASIRSHLLKIHQIDLERPGAFVVEPENKIMVNSSSSSNCSAAAAAGSENLIRNSSPHMHIEIKQEVHDQESKPRAGEMGSNHSLSLPRDFSIRALSSNQNIEVFQPDQRIFGTLKRSMSPPIGDGAAAAAEGSSEAKQRCRKPGETTLGQGLPWKCVDCNIVFPNQTLYFLHRGFHSDINPWKCNGCGQICSDMYDFNTHLVSDSHN